MTHFLMGFRLLLLAVLFAAVYAEEGIALEDAEMSGIYRDSRGEVLSDWKEKCRIDAVKTIKGTVLSTLKGITTTETLAETVRLMCRDWDEWKDSGVFRLKNTRDMDAYGNLVSFKTLCGTLKLASEIWSENSDNETARMTLKKAVWMEKQAIAMCAAVASVIRMQGYSDYMPGQIEIIESEYQKMGEVFKEYAGGLLEYGKE